MAKKGKRRGSGGHPAKVAAARQRERAERERSDDAARLVRMARGLADEAAGLSSPIEVELWASELVGSFWSSLQTLTLEEANDVEEPGLAFGAPLLAQLAEMDDAGAAMAVMAISELDDGELGLLARGVMDDYDLWRRLPPWAGEIGEIEVTAAALIADHVFDDAPTVLIEGRHADGESLAVSVLINHNVGGLALDALAIPSIEAVRQNMEAEPLDEAAVESFTLESIEPAAAANMIAMAIMTTDETFRPHVSPEYWATRALALLFWRQTDGPGSAEEPPEMTPDEQMALLDAFLASPEGDGLAADGDEARIVATAIEYAWDFAGGDPFRWSPDAVDVFIHGWIPEETDEGDLSMELVRSVMDAWVRYAGRRRGTPEAAIALTRAAIAQVAAESAGSDSL